MKIVGEERLHYKIRCLGLPLAVYQEVAAHLQQVEGVEVGLNAQEAGKFDYAQSQVGSLWFRFNEESVSCGRDRESTLRMQIDRILVYYGQRYGLWEQLES